jgi:protein arginine kinase
MTAYSDPNVISSRVRFARNVYGVPFPRQGMSPEAVVGIVNGARDAAEGLFAYKFRFMHELSRLQSLAMVERHKISPNLAANTATGALILSTDEEISIMLCEEDHVREQCVLSGLCLHEAYDILKEYDDKLLSILPVAYDDEYGFLTSCPTNLGAAMRASVMLFLPALKLAGAIDGAIHKYTKQYGLTVRGVYGEGSAAKGDMYQVSNSRSLGIPEAEILDIVTEAAEELLEREQEARQSLVARRGVELIDKIHRSYGILTNAYIMSSDELMKLISDVKLGMIMGMLPSGDLARIDELVLFCSAANLALAIGEDCPPKERDIRRAELVRKTLAR